MFRMAGGTRWRTCYASKCEIFGALYSEKKKIISGERSFIQKSKHGISAVSECNAIATNPQDFESVRPYDIDQ